MRIDQLCDQQLEWMIRARYMRGWMKQDAVRRVMFLDYLIRKNCEETSQCEALLADCFESTRPWHRFGMFER